MFSKLVDCIPLPYLRISRNLSLFVCKIADVIYEWFLRSFGPANFETSNEFTQPA